MNNPHIFDILQRFQQGELSLENAASALSTDAAQLLTHATVDTERQQRTGQPETIFGEGKSVEQIIPIIQVLIDNNQTAFVTRLDENKGKRLLESFPNGEWNPVGRTFLLYPPRCSGPETASEHRADPLFRKCTLVVCSRSPSCRLDTTRLHG